LNALVRFSLALASIFFGISSFCPALASPDVSVETGKGIVEVLACLGSVEGASKADEEGGKT